MNFYGLIFTAMMTFIPSVFYHWKKHVSIPAVDKSLDIICHKNNSYLTKMGTPRLNFNITLDLSVEKTCSGSMRVPQRWKYSSK